MRSVVVLVSNDLVFDQRVAKVCSWLHGNGFAVTLVGRLLPDSGPVSRPYPCRRFRLPAKRGAFFYAFLNIRFFFYLLFNRFDVVLANDLDTLPAAFLAARLKGRHVVYDSHEYFTEAEGLTGRPFQKRVWQRIESWIFPRLQHVYTVNASIASIYEAQYGVTVGVLRNVPESRAPIHIRTRAELGLPENKCILILQGAFIDPDRGGREAVLAMEHLPDCHLLIVGSGRDLQAMDRIIAERGLQSRITRLPRLPYEVLREYTARADIGLSLDKPVHLNYLYSLPNKLFDYLHAGIPVLASDLPEVRKIMTRYEVGMLLEEVTPGHVAAAVREMLESPRLAHWRSNTLRAAGELNWQIESRTLSEIFGSLQTKINP
ncbi:MAG: glycosyltransferase [Flavobacteriales bacterium]|jgi:glycosyltransferase involved in cell wall biosynthesis